MTGYFKYNPTIKFLVLSFDLILFNFQIFIDIPHYSHTLCRSVFALEETLWLSCGAFDLTLVLGGEYARHFFGMPTGLFGGFEKCKPGS